MLYKVVPFSTHTIHTPQWEENAETGPARKEKDRWVDQRGERSIWM